MSLKIGSRVKIKNRNETGIVVDLKWNLVLVSFIDESREWINSKLVSLFT